MKKQIINPIFLSFLLIFVLSLFSSLNVKWGDQRWHSIIAHDANGYYAYLPAVFIYHDLSFGFYDHLDKEKKTNINLIYDYREHIGNHTVNKYYLGTAIAEMPFFLMAHSLSEPLGFESDGFSKIYYVFISLAAIFYLMLGLFYLNKTLLLFEISEYIRAISILTIYFGTHLFFYALFEPGMSHIYSFAFISMLIYYGKNYFNSAKLKEIIILAGLIGIIILIRPVNILVLLLIPFLAENSVKLWKGFRFIFDQFAWRLLLGMSIIFLVGFIQLLVYKIQTGDFIVYSYTEEGFNFMDPHMLDILFSYKKGLFLYTPVLLLALFGWTNMYRKNKFEATGLLMFFFILTYVLASWWSWWYGGSFSSRVYVEYLPLFGILLAHLLKGLKKKILFKATVVVIVLLIFFNQKQTYLYRTGNIHFVDMDKAQYWQSVVEFF